ncbi:MULTISPECIES: hypothetical protein [unclassified Streptomyces]|uniref:hypothetical protein n=1 Tax=unclassified Streptomyces TaxID=2593676 RepID=UPI00380948A6
MSPASGPPAAPATPAGLRTRPAHRRGHRWIALLLVLAALLGTGAATSIGGAEARPASAAPAPDPGTESYEPAAPATGLPPRPRRHTTGLRSGRPPLPHHGGRRSHRAPAPAPVPGPRGGAFRCVVMRC